jgi:hypothetical protein
MAISQKVEAKLAEYEAVSQELKEKSDAFMGEKSHSNRALYEEIIKLNEKQGNLLTEAAKLIWGGL